MKTINLLDKNSNSSILLAGICALIIGIGVARFSFTALLPAMLVDFLDVRFAGLLASINYIGYLTGALVAMFIKSYPMKIYGFRLGIVLSMVTTLSLAMTSSPSLWILSRLFAGFGSAFIMVIGSAMVMSKLKIEQKTKVMGVYFSGVGFSILLTDVVANAVLVLRHSWIDSWLVLAFFGLMLAVYSLYILDLETHRKATTIEREPQKTLFTPFMIVLIIAYFTEGIGFSIQATFLPDIINSLEGLQGYGGYTWTLVGLAGIPSCIIWMRLAHQYGSIPMIVVAMLLQIMGIMISALTVNIYLNLLSGVLYGGTFIGLTALFMHLGGELAKKSPIVMMGALTTAYGLGQIIAPLYSIALVHQYGNYDYALYLTSFIVLCGVLVLVVTTKILKSKEKKCLSSIS